MMRFSQYRKKVPGFSLVEVAIVLAIIGVMAGVVLQGKRMLESAKMGALAEEIVFILIDKNFLDPTNKWLTINDKQEVVIGVFLKENQLKILENKLKALNCKIITENNETIASLET